MKTKLYSLALAIAALTFSSCHDDFNIGDSDQVGRLAAPGLDVVNSENIISRASSIDTSDFIVTINDSEGAVVGQWKYSEMPELVTLPVNTGYTVKVISHVQEKQAWDKPYFEGVSEAFDITADKITKLSTIACKLSNIKVTIRYSEAMKKAMGSDCKVTVIANDEGRLEFLPDETRAGYFEALSGSSTLIATFSGTVNGHSEELRRVFTDVEAGQHRIITYSLKTGNDEVPDETGEINMSGITVDMSTVDESVEGNVAPDEDVIDGNRPGQEDPEEPDTPGGGDSENTDAQTITFENGTNEEGVKSQINLDGGVTTVDADAEDVPYIVVIKSVNPIATVNVKIVSESLTPQTLNEVGLASEFNLDNPATDKLATGLTSLGFPIRDEVVGKNEITFDITQFVPLLGMYSGTHQFVLTVTDNAGNTKTVTLTFKV
jgi:hypothetical protein